MAKAIASLFGFLLFLSPLHCDILQTEGNGYLETKQDQLVLHVKGSPYEMGYQHGKLLKDKIERNIALYIDNPSQGSNERTSAFLKKLPDLLAFIPEQYKEEMQGLADGAEIPLQKILILNLFPEMFHCFGVTAAGNATEDHSLYHVRGLDYGIGKNLQTTAVLIIAEPNNSYSFLNVSYAGFIGSVTGMNSQKISIGEIGGQGYGHWNGMPMSFLFRELLEKASSLDEARQLLSSTPRTCEYYYIVSDGKTNTSFATYATESQIHFVEPGTTYAMLAPKDLPKNFGTDGNNDKFFLDDCSLVTSEYQTVIKDKQGNAAAIVYKQPQDTLLLTGYPYEERYPVLAERVLESYGKISVANLIEISRLPVSRPTSLHCAIFHPETLEIWIAHAGPNDEPACEQRYFYFQMEDLLERQP